MAGKRGVCAGPALQSGVAALKSVTATARVAGAINTVAELSLVGNIAVQAADNGGKLTGTQKLERKGLWNRYCCKGIPPQSFITGWMAIDGEQRQARIPEPARRQWPVR